MPHLLYDSDAALWPLVAGDDYYDSEARRLLPVLLGGRRGAKRAGKPTLLELGVGGGHVIRQLTPHFSCVGVDLSPGMVRHSRRLNPGVEHFVGDMRTIRLDRAFDAVLLHDSVHYMLSRADLLAAFRTAAAHLRPGGLVLAAPGYVRETYRDNDISHGFTAGALSHTAWTRDPDPRDTTYVLTMLLFVRKRRVLHVIEDRHTLGIFPVATWLSVMKEAGFRAAPPRLKRRAGRVTPSQDVLFLGRLM